jgi:hypothetical protein
VESVSKSRKSGTATDLPAGIWGWAAKISNLGIQCAYSLWDIAAGGNYFETSRPSGHNVKLAAPAAEGRECIKEQSTDEIGDM